MGLFASGQRHAGLNAQRRALPRSLLAGLLVIGALPVMARHGVTPAAAQQARAAEPWVCTAIPRRFWLPISVLTERLAEQGLTVIEAIETRDDCYALRLRDRARNERTVIYDPVSAKPLR